MPRVPMHDTDVTVVQLLVAQSASASTADTVASAEAAKFMPASVMLAATEATLYGDEAVGTGAAKITVKTMI